MKKKSAIRKATKEEIQNLVNSSYSMQEVLNKLGYICLSGNFTALSKRIKAENICLKQFNKNKKEKREQKKKISDSNIFEVNEKISRDRIKKAIIRNKLIPYKCAECANEGVYNQKPLSLQLDHINGVSIDHRLKNLRFLCPNCHSQTPNFAGKKLKKSKIKKSRKGVPLLKKRKVERPAKEALESDIKLFTITSLSKKYGVSDTAIRKWCKTYNINYKKLSPFALGDRKHSKKC